MSFSVALAVHNFAGVEEMGHLALSPEVVGSECSLRRLRGREVRVGRHGASRALALVPCFVLPLSRAAARKPQLLSPLEC